MFISRFILPIAFICIVLTQSNAQCDTKLLASNGETNDYNGRSCSIDGDRALVCAPWNGPGICYLYDWNGTNWVETILTASDGTINDDFGSSCSVLGDRIVIGAEDDDDFGSSSGSIYVFDFDGSQWIETKILASDLSADDNFGGSVSQSGDRIIAGAAFQNSAGNDAGAAYIFDWNGSTWVETKLLPSDNSQFDFFGRGVDIDGDRIIVGANGGSTFSHGQAYIYDWDGTTWLETKLLASDGAPSDQFGYAVSILQDVAIVGAYLDDDFGTSSGSVYRYELNGGSWQENKMTPSNATVFDRYGFALGITNDRIVISAHLADPNSSGAIYVYDKNGSVWNESILLSSDIMDGDQLGWSVDISGNRIVAGANREDELGLSAGAGYIFENELVYLDSDNDGFGDNNNFMFECGPPTGAWITAAGDCDDTNPNINPLALEICDGVDNDCNGSIDDLFQCQCPNGTIANTFLGTDNLWNNVANWSIGVIPTLCHDVLIPSGLNAVLLPSEYGECHTLEVVSGGELEVPQSATLYVRVQN